MGLINLEESEMRAIAAIEMSELYELIDSAIQEEQLSPLHQLPLRPCGDYVSGKVTDFGDALARYRVAKSPQKREDARYYAEKAGRDLAFAVSQMKSRLETEQREGSMFRVFDPLFPCSDPAEKMRVRVSYRWRSNPEAEWIHGSIEFLHEVPPDFGLPKPTFPPPRRKPSRAAVAGGRRRRLYLEWEHLLQIAHWAVRDYFKEGRPGSGIPATFDVKLGYGGQINNRSANFWET